MKIKIEVKQEIVDGKLSPQKYSLFITIPYRARDIHWEKDAMFSDLDAETIKELIPLLTKELENALKIPNGL